MPTSAHWCPQSLRDDAAQGPIRAAAWPRPVVVALMVSLLTSLSMTSLVAQVKTRALPVSKSTAQEASKVFAKEFRAKDHRRRLAAVTRLTSMKHKLVVKCLAKALKDPAVAVRAAAASRLGLQDPKDANKHLQAALSSCKANTKPRLILAILEGIQGLKLAPDLKLIKKRFDAWPKEVQREVFRALKYHRSKDALKFMAQKMAEPKPGNVDSPTNPPASYWRDRVIGWRFWITDLHDSVHSLTGEYLDEPEDLKKWMRRGKIPPLEGDKPKKK